MSQLIRVPSVSAPSVQDEDGVIEDEKQPILGSRESGLKKGVKRQDSVVDVVKHPSTWNWRNLIVLATLVLAYCFVGAAYSVIGPFFPSEALKKGSSSTMTGIIFSASPLCVAIFSPIIGYFLPTLGLRYTLVSGLLLVGGPFVLLGFTAMMPSGWVFILFCILLRMTEGVGSAMLSTASFSLLPELFPNRLATVMGLFEVSGGLGFAAAPPIGGFLYSAGGFKLPFITVGVLVLLFVIPMFFLLGKMKTKAKAPVPLKALLKLSTNFTIIILVLANLLALAALGFFDPTLQPFLLKEFKLTNEQVGLVFFSGPICYVLLSLLVGSLADKFGPRGFVITGFFICGIGYCLVGPADFIAAPTLWVSIVAFCVIGVGVAFGTVPIYSDLLKVAKSMKVVEDEHSLNSIVSGVASSSMSFGEFLGPLIGGVLLQVENFQDSAVLFGEILLAEGFLLLGATLIDLAVKRRNQH